MVLTGMSLVVSKQSQSGRYVVVADLSVPAFEVRHLLHDDVYEVVCRYVGRPNVNSTSLVKRVFKNIVLF